MFFLLIYADDLVLFFLKEHMWETLTDYSVEWNWKINASRTKVVVFRIRGKIHRNEEWEFNKLSMNLTIFVLCSISTLVYLNIQKNRTKKLCFRYAPVEKKTPSFNVETLFSKCTSLKKTIFQCINTVFCSVLLHMSYTCILSYASEI